MKRVLLAAVLAVLFHGVLFGMNFGWLSGRTVRMPQQRLVTVTMSYRPPPVPKMVAKTPVERQKILKPKKIIVPTRTPPEKIAAKPIEPEPVPADDIEVSHPEEAPHDPEDEPDIQEGGSGDAVSNMKVTQEAVPLYRVNPPPGYPKAARRRGYQGRVILSVLVNEEGRVDNLWVLESCGYRLLDNSAVKAVKDWVFEPGREGDRKVSMWVKIPVRFELK